MPNIVVVDSSPFIRQYGWGFIQKNLSRHRYEADRRGFFDTYIKCIETQVQEEVLYYESIQILLAKRYLSGSISLNPAIQSTIPSVVSLFGTDLMKCVNCGDTVAIINGIKQEFHCACGGELSCGVVKYGEHIDKKAWRTAQNVIASAHSLIVDPKIQVVPLCRALVEYSGKPQLYCPDIVQYIINKAREV